MVGSFFVTTSHRKGAGSAGGSLWVSCGYKKEWESFRIMFTLRYFYVIIVLQLNS